MPQGVKYVVGVPNEIKTHESRVALIPVGVEELTRAGHKVLIQSGAGQGSGISDEQYRQHGAEIVSSAADVWQHADLIVKVKEPLAVEWPLMRAGQIVFTYFHFAADECLTRAVMKSGVTAIAYETIRDAKGNLPLLTPMSEVAGRMSIQEGAKFLERPFEGRGILLGGVPGVAPANVVVLGGGIVGNNAAKMQLGLGANVIMIDKNLNRLREIDDIFNGHLVTLASNAWTIGENLKTADLVIGAVLIPGASAPKLVKREMIATMKRGAVVVDVAIDQGGCFETSHSTTHTEPIYFVDGVLHYCVSNMPAAVPHTSTFALTNATFPYLLELANHGLEAACERHPGLKEGVNTYNGYITYAGVAESQGRQWRELAAVE